MASSYLLSFIDELPLVQQRVLRALAVFYLPADEYQINHFLTELERQEASDSLLSSSIDLQCLEQWVVLGLLNREEYTFFVSEELQEVLARRAALKGEYAKCLDAAQSIVAKARYAPKQWVQPNDLAFRRNLRDAFYLKAWDDLERLMFSHQYRGPIGRVVEILADIVCQSFEAYWLQVLPEDFQLRILKTEKLTACLSQKGAEYDYLKSKAVAKQWLKIEFYWLLAGIELELDDIQAAKQILPLDETWQSQCFWGQIAVLSGDYQSAVNAYDEALKSYRKQFRKRTAVLPEPFSLYHLLSRLSLDGAKAQATTVALAKHALKLESGRRESDLILIAQLLITLAEGTTLSLSVRKPDIGSAQGFRDHVFFCLAYHWAGENLSANAVRLLEQGLSEPKGLASPWIQLLSFDLLIEQERDTKKSQIWAQKKQKKFKQSPLVSVLPLVTPIPAWQRALDALEELTKRVTHKPLLNSQIEQRVIWVLNRTVQGYDLSPREQRKNKDGDWRKGRSIHLQRLIETPEDFPFLSDADVQICQVLSTSESSGYNTYSTSDYSVTGSDVLLAAVDHPAVFWEGQLEHHLHISLDEPALVVKEQSGQLLLTLEPSTDPERLLDGFLSVEKIGQQKLRLASFSPQHLNIAEVLGFNGLSVPVKAREQVLQSIKAIAPLLPIHSDIGGGEQLGAREYPALTRFVCQILPQQHAYKFSLFVQPLGLDGPEFQPGVGRSRVMAMIDGEQRLVCRDLEDESERFHALLQACPALIGENEEGDWELPDQEALEVLYQLQQCQDDVQLMWPMGGKLTVTKAASLSQLVLSIRRQNDWFALEGGLALDESKVISMKTLLNHSKVGKGRFIPLENGHFLTLTAELKARLQGIAQQGESQYYHALAVHTLDELTDGTALTVDLEWKAAKERLSQAYQQPFKIPIGLEAQLRDYQIEGFQWLSRLAQWGAGACLADDMGLGKTLQALALMLSKASQGPCLVLAPTSVCQNWFNEIHRFVPTIKVSRFGEGDRKSMIEQAGPNEIIICSYGLMFNEQELLRSIEWQTMVVDEAQALKNHQAKRSLAAFSLRAKYKVAMTGTPIENHLGELWSIFRLINPGLLGTLDDFNLRFAQPIENEKDPAASAHLKRLVKPFILRRLKTQVLKQLPARTEVVYQVTLSEEEKVFYEALRRQALDRLSEKSDNPGQKRMQVLAEIMRLRRACCHPRLIDDTSVIPSAKLTAFNHILKGLRENQHKVLVFSQFVSHLALVRESLDEQKISYQYLDGSTSPKRRDTAINAFQAGQGELFLISLKAGGAGINLTAADYVIHLDPWWNPAVEDQASDRAHRLGQQKPVTIYRMVTDGTIEQKIIGLHQHKRDLADSLLSGSELSGRLSLDEVMGLIKTEA